MLHSAYRAIKRRTAPCKPNSLDCSQQLSQYANCSLSNRLGLFHFHGGHISKDRGALPALQWLQDIHSGSIGHQNGTTRRKVSNQVPRKEASKSLRYRIKDPKAENQWWKIKASEAIYQCIKFSQVKFKNIIWVYWDHLLSKIKQKLKKRHNECFLKI